VEQGLVDKEQAQSRAKDASEFLRMLNITKEAKQAKAAVEAPPAEAPPVDGQEPPKPTSGVRGQPNRPGYKRE
jgi:hypothetical protein